MSQRLTGPLLAVIVALVVVAAAVALVACGEQSDSGATVSPSPSPSPSSGVSAAEALSFGEPATVGGFTMTPTNVADRGGDIYDVDGNVIEGKGITVTIKVNKQREPNTSGASGENIVPVATIVDAQGKAMRMDDLLGLTLAETQGIRYAGRYERSYQLAVVRPAGTKATATLWFNVPEGFAPELLVIDGGGEQQAAWRLP